MLPPLLLLLSLFCSYLHSFSFKKKDTKTKVCQGFLSTKKVAKASSVGRIFETMFCKCNTFAFPCLILLSCGLLHETHDPRPFSGPSVRLNECKNYFLLLWCKNIHMVRQHVAFGIFTLWISSACVCANEFFIGSVVVRGSVLVVWMVELWELDSFAWTLVFICLMSLCDAMNV